MFCFNNKSRVMSQSYSLSVTDHLPVTAGAVDDSQSVTYTCVHVEDQRSSDPL
jgi:hypothetical protein